MGPLITGDQFHRVREYFDVAAAEQATSSGGFHVEPTVYTGVDNSIRIAQEEIFGPVLVVIPFDTTSRPSRSPTTPTTGSSPDCGPTTSRARSPSARNCVPARCSSTPGPPDRCRHRSAVEKQRIRAREGYRGAPPLQPGQVRHGETDALHGAMSRPPIRPVPTTLAVAVNDDNACHRHDRDPIHTSSRPGYVDRAGGGTGPGADWEEPDGGLGEASQLGIGGLPEHARCDVGFVTFGAAGVEDRCG